MQQSHFFSLKSLQRNRTREWVLISWRDFYGFENK